jgi:hypothetical protein
MKIKLNKDFYDETVIEEALKDFKGVCNGKKLNDNIEIELEVKENNENLKQEFCNYVLGLMKNKIMV